MRRATALVAVVGLLLVGCGDDDGGDGDLTAYCDAVQALRDDDPFADLAVASPEEMQTAFEQLRTGAEDVARHAPPEQRPRAEEYRDSITVLVDEMRAAGYDLRSLDDFTYRSAVDDYFAAAVSVDNGADATCP